MVNNNGARLAALLASLLLFAVAAVAEHPVVEAQHHQREATKAYQSGDYAGFTRSMERAHELNPMSYPTKYNLACGYARTGRAEDALELLEQLTLAQVDYGMADDPDLESLRKLSKFQELVDLLEASIAPINNSTLRSTIDQLGIMAEGIALDAATGRLFFGSMRSGDIYVIDADGQMSRFASLAGSGTYGAIGMTVDTHRKILWSVGTWFFMVEDFDEEVPLASGVFGFDLETGELKHHYLADISVTGLNDVTVAPNGDVYVSGNVLYVLKAGTDEIEVVRTSPEPFGSNGLTVDPTGSTLFVSSYPVGIGAIDIKSGELRYLDAPENTSLYGIDGLYWYEGDLIGIQNGILPWRLIRMELNDDLTAVTNVRIIEFANDALLPTTGAIDGDRIHYVGQGPAPDSVPSQIPAQLARFSGKTIIMTAPLDE